MILLDPSKGGFTCISCRESHVDDGCLGFLGNRIYRYNYDNAILNFNVLLGPLPSNLPDDEVFGLICNLPHSPGARHGNSAALNVHRRFDGLVVSVY